MSLIDSFIIPEWPAPTNVRAMVTTRVGGVSVAPFDSFNLLFMSTIMPLLSLKIAVSY
jgi:copper oxidase (laccase) domain-containing protein